jgi:hypothetical protein
MLSWYKLAQVPPKAPTNVITQAPAGQTAPVGQTAQVGQTAKTTPALGPDEEANISKMADEVERIVKYLKNKFIALKIPMSQEIASNLGASGRINNMLLSELPYEYGQKNPEIASVNAKLEELMRKLIDAMPNQFDANNIEKQIQERLVVVENRAAMLGAKFKKQTAKT